VFAALGRLTTRHPFLVIAAWLLVAAAAAAFAIGGLGGQGIFDRLKTSELRVPGSGSEKASVVLENSGGGTSISMLVAGVSMTDQALLATLAPMITTARMDLTDIAHVATVLDPWAVQPPDPRILPYLATDGKGFIIAVTLAEKLSDADDRTADTATTVRLRTLGADIVKAVPDASYKVSSNRLISAEINDVMERDLIRAEAVSLPISLIVMVFVFGGLLAASMPIIGAVASILGGLGMVLVLSYVMKLDAVTVNVVTVLGLGLSIDYGLLTVSRFREELHAVGATPTGGPSRKDPLVQRAVQRTVATAGRTVSFSALTIAISVLGLLAMSPDILRGIGVAAASVVVLALLSAVTLLPAVLTVFGHRFVRESLLTRVPVLRTILTKLGDVSTDHGAFSLLARWVQKRAWFVIAGALAILAVALLPLGGLQLRNTGLGLLPDKGEQATYFADLADSYPYLASPDAYVVTQTDPGDSALTTLSDRIAKLDNVKGVDPAVRLKDGHVLLQVRFGLDDPGGKEGSTVVKQIRDLDTTLLVAGEAAGQIDFADALRKGVPLAAALVIAATFILLFLMTGSLLVPVKAFITNGISIAASLGIATWIFTKAHGFATTGLESYIVALVAAFGFGLAMDYEVFLLDRVKELYDTGHDNDTAVRIGLQRSGRIITSAASVIVVVFLGFGTGSMLPIQQIGIALAIVVVLDASLVRMLLVPATLTVLGDLNWWAPSWARRFAGGFAIAVTPRRASEQGHAGVVAAAPRRAAGQQHGLPHGPA
jgi:RND superfamily putative drug exporter